MRVTFERSQDEAANITTFYFRPERPVQFTAGQFAEWTLKHPHPDSRGIKRWFTISSPPNQELVSLTTKFTSKNGSSYKKALRSLMPGDELQLSDPLGDFVLPKLIQTPLIFVAAGIGVTPFNSILSWLSETNEIRPIRLLYGVQNEDEIIFLSTFERANQHATIIVNEASPAWGGERGLLNAELILGLEKPSEDTLVYVSGPEVFVQKLRQQLLAAGLPSRQIVVDEFANYRDI